MLNITRGFGKKIKFVIIVVNLLKNSSLFGIIGYISYRKEIKMKLSNNFDKLSTPLMVCSSDWKIVYKNRACKNFLPVPRCSNYICKCFIDGNETLFPNKDQGVERLELEINGSFKSALCFEYFGYAIILFPVLLEYEAFEYENDGYSKTESADILRSMISALNDEEIQNEDRYHRLEDVKRYVYSSLENTLAYSVLCSGQNPLYPALQLYKLVKDKITSVVMKAGYRVQIDIDSLAEFGDMFALNAVTSSLVFSNMLMFCLSVSKNKTSFADVSMSGEIIRNKIYFRVANDAFCGQTNSIEDFLYGKPAEYLNILPFECMCKEFGWRVEYKSENDGVFNACLCFDIGVESIDSFNSEEVFAKSRDYSQSVSMLIERVLAAL